MASIRYRGRPRLSTRASRPRHARTMTAGSSNRLDPRGLIREAYRIEGLDIEGCRAIFFDWVVGLEAGLDAAAAARALHGAYAPLHPDHPMTRILAEAAEGRAEARRRGGRRGRLPQG